MQKKTRIALIAFAALALPAAAAAQDTQPAAPPAQPAAPAAAPQQELEQIQQRLAALQRQASQDAAIQAQAEALKVESIAAMDRLDPGAKAKRDRADALRAEVQAAQAAGDNARLNTLAAEAQQLQQYFTEFRPRMMQDATYAEKQQAFTAAMVAKMTELDPQTPTLIARLQELRTGGAAPAAPATPPAPQGGQQ